MKSEILFKSKRKTKETDVWNKILINWIKVHKKYMKISEVDNAYFYNERASLSLLAASIWQSNGIAIEEYSSEKNHEDGIYNGRVDLWFQIDKYYCVVESKQVFKRVINKNIESISSDIDFKMKEAIKDARSSMQHEKIGYAVVFFTPTILISKPVPFEIIHSEVIKSDYDFISYIKGNESNHYDNPKDPKRIFPAGYIIGKKITLELKNEQ